MTVKFTEINEDNWVEAAQLTVWENQKGFVAPAVGILARGYAFRRDRARVIGVTDEDRLAGLMLVRDLKEEPACYDLMEVLIDWRHQGKGVGTAAVTRLLALLRKEHAFDCVEVCVKKENTLALHVYEKCGFADTGYIDPDVPDSLNLRCML